MVLITDDNGMIKGTEKLGPEFFELAANTGILADAAPGITIGRFGDEGGKLCCADHIHPHTDSWKNDPEIIRMKNEISELSGKFAQEHAENTGEFTINLVEIFTKVAELALIIIVWAADVGFSVAPYVINALIRALNRAIDLNLKEVEIDGETVSLSELIDKLEELL